MARILVIDDDAYIQSIIKKRLLRRGYEVSVATNGKRALKRLRTKQYDAILVDLLLPDIPGRDIIEIIKKEELMPLKRVLVLTGVHNVQNATAYMQFGVFAYIGKPFDFDNLFSLLDRCCGDDPPPTDLDAIV